MSTEYDFLVIGSGPAGQRAAIQGAKLGRRVALVERRELGGVSVNWGTIPSKTLREAIVYLTGLSQRATYGQSYRVKEEITIEDLRLRTRSVIDGEVVVVPRHLPHWPTDVTTGVRVGFNRENLKHLAANGILTLEPRGNRVTIKPGPRTLSLVKTFREAWIQNAKAKPAIKKPGGDDEKQGA